MACDVLGKGGMTIIVCGPRKRLPTCSAPGCRRPAPWLCDHPLDGEKAGKTCDRALCEVHRVHVSSDTETGVDYCRIHAAMSKSDLRDRDPRVGPR